MKKITLVLAALILGLTSCSDGSTSDDSEKPLLQGYYEVWYITYHSGVNTSTDAWILDTWKKGYWIKNETANLYFEGDWFWDLINDRTTANGAFSYTKTHITWLRTTQRYTVIDKDTVFFHMIYDDPSGISKGYSQFVDKILKKTDRKGHMEHINGYWLFVDDSELD